MLEEVPFVEWPKLLKPGVGQNTALWSGSTKQETAVRFTYNIHIPSKFSPPLCTHRSSRLRQDSKAFWWSEGDNAWGSELKVFLFFFARFALLPVKIINLMIVVTQAQRACCCSVDIFALYKLSLSYPLGETKFIISQVRSSIHPTITTRVALCVKGGWGGGDVKWDEIGKAKIREHMISCTRDLKAEQSPQSQGHWAHVLLIVSLST